MSDSGKPPIYVGSSGSLALFSLGEKAIVLDLDYNIVVGTGITSVLANHREWEIDPEVEIPESALELAQASLTDLSIKVVTASASGRMYTIPKGAQSEAKKALDWRAEHHRGGTPVGLNTARILARGGQIGIHKVRHIAKYFPRHEVDKRGKGWAPGDEGFPSNGRIAWALWGGDTAWRWAQAIVERENKSAKTASAAITAGADLDSFKKAFYLDPLSAPDFIVRVRLDGSGMDRLYKIDTTGEVYVWDDGQWDNLGAHADIWEYDKDLDDPDDLVEKSHIPIDPDSAIIIAARMEQDPYGMVSVGDIDAEEAALAMFAASDMDWDVIDYTLTAAGVASEDGVYSKEKREDESKNENRSSLGKFALESGSKEVEKPEQESEVPEKKEEEKEEINRPLDTSGILGEPREPINQPYAHTPALLPALTSSDLHDIMNNWDGWVQSERNAKKSGIQSSGDVKEEVPVDEYDAAKKSEEVEDKKSTPDRHTHPLLYKWLLSRNKTTKKEKEDDWAKTSILAAGETPAPLKTQAKPSVQMTPENSDVKPLYFAIVADDDPRAVLNLICIVPASSNSTSPTVYKRQKGKWVKDIAILNDLKSATPPPVIPLTPKVLNDVLLQVDKSTMTASGIYDVDHLLMVLWGPRQEIMDTYGNQFFDSLDKNQEINDTFKAVFSLVSAGGLDRNRGNAEKLRHYWTVGRGGLKLRWNTGGDWTRCVRHLSKYLGPRAKGYCSLRHKEMTGLWTGDKAHRQMYGRKKNGRNVFSTEYIKSSSEVLTASAVKIKSDLAKERFGILASAIQPQGASFCIPLVVPENVESGDGRKFKKNSITFRDLPLPLLWQIKTAEGHMGSVVVGRIDKLERTADGLGNAYGVFDTGVYGQEAERLVRNGFLRGISADMDQFEATEEKPNLENSEEDSELKKNKITINKARVMAATIVSKPAFQECSIHILHNDNNQVSTLEGINKMQDGIYVDEVDASDAQALVACGIVASSIPTIPPAEWFENPKLTEPTPLTVDDFGRVYGHIAAWHVDHIGLTAGTKPPRSRSNYAYFHTGVVRADDGNDYPVGQLTLAGGHAPLEANAYEAVKHYDDTASAIADVHAGEDQFGIWVAGALRPSAQPEQIRALRASAPSGDWRPIRGALELVAVCQVNVPGFPIARARVASGAVMALVAAGAATLAKLKADPINELKARLDKLEKYGVNTPDLEARVASLKARIEEAKTEFAYISRDQREILAKEGKALPDGSYPIRNVEDLRAAIHAYGRSNESDRAKVRKHIMKRARQLNFRHLIPEKWKTAESDAITASAEDLRNRLEQVASSLGKAFAAEDEIVPVDAPTDISPAAEEIPVVEEAPVAELPAKEEKGQYIPGVNQPRDNRGRFLDVLARLKSDLGPNASQDVVDKVQEADKLVQAGNYAESVEASRELIGILDKLDSGALNKIDLQNVKNSAAELGKIITNLPLPFQDPNAKLRYSDLPPVLKNLLDQMVDRVTKKIGKDDATKATSEVRQFISGSELFSQSDLSKNLAKMLRLLT